jgi:hypothetical protein
VCHEAIEKLTDFVGFASADVVPALLHHGSTMPRRQRPHRARRLYRAGR